MSKKQLTAIALKAWETRRRNDRKAKREAAQRTKARQSKKAAKAAKVITLPATA
jgi:hypothetical protein